MIYSDKQIEYIKEQIKDHQGIKQIYGHEQKEDGDLYFKGLADRGHDFDFRFKPETGTVFVKLNGQWKQIQGFIIKSVHDEM
jgi:hypothetical protein